MGKLQISNRCGFEGSKLCDLDQQNCRWKSYDSALEPRMVNIVVTTGLKDNYV